MTITTAEAKRDLQERQKRPTIEAKETYYRGKRDQLQRQKETYYRGKRDLLQRQKETYYRGKKRHTTEAKVLQRQKRPTIGQSRGKRDLP